MYEACILHWFLCIGSKILVYLGKNKIHVFQFPPFEEEDDIFAKGDLKEPLNYDMTDVTPHGLFRVMDYTANKTPATTPDTVATPAGIKRRR